MRIGFPGGSAGKESTCSVGDLSSIPGLGRSSGEGNGNPLQHSCLENLMDRAACQATAHGVAKSQTTEQLSHIDEDTESSVPRLLCRGTQCSWKGVREGFLEEGESVNVRYCILKDVPSQLLAQLLTSTFVVDCLHLFCEFYKSFIYLFRILIYFLFLFFGCATWHSGS